MRETDSARKEKEACNKYRQSLIKQSHWSAVSGGFFRFFGFSGTLTAGTAIVAAVIIVVLIVTFVYFLFKLINGLFDSASRFINALVKSLAEVFHIGLPILAVCRACLFQTVLDLFACGI